MKFGEKIFIITLSLFLAVFNFSIFLIADKNRTVMYNAEMQRVFGIHYFISKNISNNIASKSDSISEGYLKNVMDIYSQYYKKDNICLELLKDGKVVFSNAKNFTGKRDELTSKIDYDSRGIIRTVDNTKYIYVTGNTMILNDYTLVCVYDLSNVDKTYSKLTNYLITISVIVSSVLAILLYIVLKKLTKPIQVLTDCTKRISDGYYDERIKTKGKDELAILGKNFNSMAKSIESNIEEMKDTVKRKQQFVDNFAHELRTPLTSIYGYAEYMQKVNITEDDKYTSTNYIMAESKRLQQIADKLLSLALLRQDNIKLDTVNIQNIFEKSLQIIHKKAAAKDIKINSRCEAEVINGDEELLISLVTNLLDNAVKASDEGDEINLSAYKNDFTVIEVKDNGFGMDMETVKNITEPFYRVDKSRSRKDGGAGLGLSLCLQIVNCHGANISFDSVPKIGTTVKVIFTTL